MQSFALKFHLFFSTFHLLLKNSKNLYFCFIVNYFNCFPIKTQKKIIFVF